MRSLFRSVIQDATPTSTADSLMISTKDFLAAAEVLLPGTAKSELQVNYPPPQAPPYSMQTCFHLLLKPPHVLAVASFR